MVRLDSSIPPPRLSVLDRLLEDEADFDGREEQTDYHAGLEAMKRFVLRDLQWLLNARVDARADANAADDPIRHTVVPFADAHGPDAMMSIGQRLHESPAIRQRVVLLHRGARTGASLAT